MGLIKKIAFGIFIFVFLITSFFMVKKIGIDTLILVIKQGLIYFKEIVKLIIERIKG